MRVGVDAIPKLTVELYPEGIQVDAVMDAVIEQPNAQVANFTDEKGRMWIRASTLATMIREEGTLCHRGENTAVACEFTDDLLRTWEGRPNPGPEKGPKKEE